jgi:magnesium chelatase family protein
MQIGIQQIDINEPSYGNNMSSKEMKYIIDRAVAIQRKRNNDGKLNGSLASHHLERIINMDQDAKEFISNVFTTLNISMRSYHKILRLSRTIADLEEKEKIEKLHIKEALLYRSFDKFVERINNVIS